MKPISFHDFRPLPGEVVEWTVSTTTAAEALAASDDPIPLSYNQELHLRSALAAKQTGKRGNPWIGTSFEIEGMVDREVLGSTFASWLRRHDALRSGFRVGASGIQRFTLPPESISLDQGAATSFGATGALHDYLGERFSAGTDPFVWPPHVLGAISRETGSTVFVALDHVVGDGYSLALAVWELQTTYEALLRHETPDLPETGSFHELCAAERKAGAAITADDPAVVGWRDFVGACGGTAPTFPLDLGVAEGQSWPQSVFNRLILSPEEAATFEAVCREADGGFFAGLLASMAVSIQSLTGNTEFRTVTPLHTRRQPTWRPAMGWFVTCAPLHFSVKGASDFTHILHRAQSSIQRAIRMGAHPALRIIELLGEDFRITRSDLFSMVSFTDYRKLPGADRHAQWKPVTIGQVTEADDSHVWLSRQHDGLHISIRHPDTPTASGLLHEYVHRIREVLTRGTVRQVPQLSVDS